MIDTTTIKQQTDLLDLINTNTSLQKIGSIEYAGPCPKCGGNDRFHVNVDKGWFCRVCTGSPDGSSGHWHDAIDYLMWRDGIDFISAYKRLGGDTTISDTDRERLKVERKRIEQERKEAEEAERQTKRAELHASQVWKEYYANLDSLNKRELWHKRGLSDLWIDYFQVGYCPSKIFGFAEKAIDSPSITIPTFRTKLIETNDQNGRQLEWHCIGLVHRLLLDNTPGGKYRPHTSGLGKGLFICDLYGQNIIGPVLLVEGEIKAMVAWAMIQDSVYKKSSVLGRFTVVGVSGKSIKPEWLDELSGASEVYICLDPDARKEAEQTAHTIGPERARLLDLPGKIDDMINEGSIDARSFEGLIKGARRVK